MTQSCFYCTITSKGGRLLVKAAMQYVRAKLSSYRASVCMYDSAEPENASISDVHPWLDCERNVIVWHLHISSYTGHRNITVPTFTHEKLD